MKTFWSYLVGILSAIAAIMYLFDKKSTPGELPKNPMKDELKDDIKKIDEKQEDIKKNGVEKKSAKEEIDYWKKN